MSQGQHHLMLKLKSRNYEVVLTDNGGCDLSSPDSGHKFDIVHRIDDSDEYRVSSSHTIRVMLDGEEICNALMLANGGASTIHENSAIIFGNSCLVAVGPYIALIQIPSLEISWVAETDFATCFGVYHSTKHQCFISHGEVDISRISYQGKIDWKASGRDIFTNGFTIEENEIHAIDWDNHYYSFSIETGKEVAT